MSLWRQRENAPAAYRSADMGKARLALGNFGDVVLIDGPVQLVTSQAIDTTVADRLMQVSALDR